MKTKGKVLILVLCAMLLVVSTVFATVAFLTSTDSVQNTFTFGQVIITLDEAEVTTNGVVVQGADRRHTNDYHLIPGHFYVKDPIVHVDADSEICWLFIKIDNDLSAIIEGKNTVDANDPAETVYTIEAQMLKNGWVLIDEQNNVWALNRPANAGENIPVFNSFTIKDDANVALYGTTKDDAGNVTGGAKIEVIAYAVQMDGFTNAGSNHANATAAWNATFGE